MNRHIFTIRSDFMGYSQEERAMAIRHRIEAAMAKGGGDNVSFRPAPEGGRFIELNGLAVFQIRPGDLDPLTGESLDEVANNAAQNLKIAVREAREQSNTDVMLKGIRICRTRQCVFFPGLQDHLLAGNMDNRPLVKVDGRLRSQTGGSH